MITTIDDIMVLAFNDIIQRRVVISDKAGGLAASDMHLSMTSLKYMQI
jgi:hypothetical protein